MELKPHLIAINEATKFNLIIILAACNGIYLSETILPIDRSPCWMMIGPTNKVYPEELSKNFTDFYEILLKTRDGDKALKALKTNPLKIGGYYIITAYNFFKLVYTRYLNEYCSPKQRDIRAKRMFREYKKSVQFRPFSKGWFKRFLKTSQHYYCEEHFNNFFMIDLYPQNKDRFPFNFKELKLGKAE